MDETSSIIHLTPTEAWIMSVFKKQGFIYHEQLIDRLSHDYIVRVHISRLRKKIGKERIVVDRQRGYRLVG